MALTVMKFGGTSVASVERLQKVADKVIKKKEAGDQVIVVVSAMGKTTDQLVSMAGEISDRPSTREMDVLLSTGEQVTIALLSMVLNERGHKAISYTGWQAGIKTEAVHENARIASIDTSLIRPQLNEGSIIIIAGFQGVTETGDITTLGRGGSDTSAVAIAEAFAAKRCEIYTDVTGVFTTDPRFVKKARKLKEISYDEMLEMAYLGAGVLHPRAVEYAKNSHLELVVCSSFTDEEGTVIKEEVSMETSKSVRGLAFEKNVTKVTLLGLPNNVSAVSRVFDTIADKKINIDVIVQNVLDEARTNLSFTVDHELLEETLDVLRGSEKELGYQQLIYESELAKLSIVGSGMASNPGVAAEMFHALASQKIKIKMISTSEIKVSTIIDEAKLIEALDTLHETFHLSEEESVSL
ncbi:aspartate kinase [Sporolactobacillus terrae]|uniref:Aspartokinase n=1 Tax=Sporolactobacillus terrae TaxID=269673 RepID=A0A410DA68_9BACL|nr:aspartate kinase [Sporolactobacillus terrae]QAA22980.1 aspartate kinase [Sporolactobacillus terrae]QAA25953.1 aspartate kinase [Sporolactobacillus terrae]UAK15053.1 aspartate kinase [Sporolactobacillus terrae]BBN99387.1 aspartokinase 2 [Sporolactobacillus terrae]